MIQLTLIIAYQHGHSAVLYSHFCLSICHVVVVYLNECMYHETFFDNLVEASFWFLQPTAITKFQWEPPQLGCKIDVEWKKLAIFNHNCHLFH